MIIQMNIKKIVAMTILILIIPYIVIALFVKEKNDNLYFEYDDDNYVASTGYAQIKSKINSRQSELLKKLLKTLVIL